MAPAVGCLAWDQTLHGGRVGVVVGGGAHQHHTLGPGSEAPWRRCVGGCTLDQSLPSFLLYKGEEGEPNKNKLELCFISPLA